MYSEVVENQELVRENGDNAITEEEINAIKKLKNMNAPGKDKISAEIIKHTKDEELMCFYKSVTIFRIRIKFNKI